MAISDDEFESWLVAPGSRPVYLAELTYRRPQWGVDLVDVQGGGLGKFIGDDTNATGVFYLRCVTSTAFAKAVEVRLGSNLEAYLDVSTTGALTGHVDAGASSVSGSMGSQTITHGADVWLALVVDWATNKMRAYINGVQTSLELDLSSLTKPATTGSFAYALLTPGSNQIYAYRSYLWQAALDSNQVAAACQHELDLPADPPPTIIWRGREGGRVRYDASGWDDINSEETHNYKAQMWTNCGGRFGGIATSEPNDLPIVEAPDYGDQTLYCATAAYTNTPTDSGTHAPVNQPYDELLIAPPTLDWRVSANLYGLADEGVGQLLLNNASGELTEIALEDWRSGRAVVSIGDISWPRDDFRPWCTATVDRAELQASQVVLPLQGRTELLKVDIVGEGVEGGLQIGRTKPVLVGRIDNGQPVLVNGSAHEYAVTGDSLLTMRARVAGVDAGFTSSGTGTFTLNAAPSGDVSVEAWANDLDTLYEIITRFTALEGTDLGGLPAPNHKDLGAGAALWSFFINNSMALPDLLHLTGAATGVTYYTQPDGKIVGNRINASARNHVFDADLVVAATVVDTLYPRIGVKINQHPNYFIQQALAASLSENDRDRYNRSSMAFAFDDDTLGDAWPQVGQSAPIDSPVFRDAYYSDESTQMGIWGHPFAVLEYIRQDLPTMRHIWQVVLNRPQPLVQLTDSARFSHPVTAKSWRFGQVVGVHHSNGTTTVDILS